MVVETLKYAFVDEIFPSITSFVFLKKFAGYTYEISYILLLLIISTGLYNYSVLNGLLQANFAGWWTRVNSVNPAGDHDINTTCYTANINGCICPFRNPLMNDFDKVVDLPAPVFASRWQRCIYFWVMWQTFMALSPPS